MLATSHILVAGSIAAKFQNPIPVACLSFISHLICDSIPHWDIGTNWKKRPKWQTGTLSIIETFIALTVAYTFFSEKMPFSILIVMVVFSLLPDWIEAPWYLFFVKNNQDQVLKKDAGRLEIIYYHLFIFLHKFHIRAQLPLGAVTQIITVAFFVLITQ